MTFQQLDKLIKEDQTGLAKEYNINFLEKEFICSYQWDSNEELRFNCLIQKDLEIFKSIEKSLLEQKKPKEGDFIQYDEKLTRLSKIHEDGDIQLSNSIGYM